MSCRQITTVSKVLLSTVETVLVIGIPSTVGGVDGALRVAPVGAQSRATHSLLSGDLPPLGLGQLHLTIPGRDLSGGRSVSRGGQAEARRPGNTHACRHLVQLAHGLVDSSFQVIIQFARSVDDRAHKYCYYRNKHAAAISRK